MAGEGGVRNFQTEGAMSFHPASEGLIPRAKSGCPLPAGVFFLGDMGNAMDDKTLQQEISELWDDLRSEGDMVADEPAMKVGMPHATPYGVVSIPAEIDGVFVMVEVPTDQVSRLAKGLLAAIPEAIRMEKALHAEIDAHCAIEKIKGQN